jgi:hypothetical protein
MMDISRLNRAISFFAICAFSVSCNSKRDGVVMKEELNGLINEYYIALADKNDAKLNELTADNFILYDNGEVFTNQSSQKMIRELPPFKATFRIDSSNAHIGKNDASMYYLREATFTMADSIYPSVKFLESATFLKEGDKWKIRFIHSTLRK